MKWVTREKVRVDRVACPWLIKKFVDPQAEFLFVPSDKVKEVAAKEGAISYDCEGDELGHQGTDCSFDSIVKKYKLADPAIRLLAKIVNGADASFETYSRPEAPGLKAVAIGFSQMGLKGDHAILEMEFPVYDALYIYCRQRIKEGDN